MPHDTLDERLRRYYDEVPALDVPHDPAAPIARARRRHRHQVTGLVAAAVLVIAGLGAYARTLLDDDQRSSGPVAVEGGLDDGPGVGLGGQTWTISENAPANATWISLGLVDDGTAIGVIPLDPLEAQGEPMPPVGPVAFNTMWRQGPGGSEPLVTGLEGVYSSAVAHGEVWVAGIVNESLTFAVSNDAGDTWTLRPTAFSMDGVDELETMDLGPGFVTVALRSIDPQRSTAMRASLVSFAEIDGELVELSTFDFEWRGRTSLRSTDAALIASGSPAVSGDGPSLRSADGRSWTETADDRLELGPVREANLWFEGFDEPSASETGPVIRSDDTSVDLAELVGADVVVADADTDGRAAVVVAVSREPGPDGQRDAWLVVSDDGVIWSSIPIDGPDDLGVLIGGWGVQIDAGGSIVVGGYATTAGTGRSVASLVVEPLRSRAAAPTTSAPDPATNDGTIGRGAQTWVARPVEAGARDEGLPTFPSVRTAGDALIALDGGGLWRWDGAWTRLDPGLDEVTSFTTRGDEIVATGTRVDPAGGQGVARSDDGGRTWTLTPVRVAGSGVARGQGFMTVLNPTLGLLQSLTTSADHHEVGRTEVDTSNGATVAAVDGEVWVAEGGTWTAGTADGISWTPRSGVALLTTRHRGVTYSVSGPGDGATLSTSNGDEVVLSDLADIDHSTSFARVHQISASDAGIAILGSSGDDFFDVDLWLLVSADGEMWRRIDVEIPDDLRVEGAPSSIAHVDEQGRIIVAPRVFDPTTGEDLEGVVVVEPEGSDSTTSRARAAADAFVEAWREGDRQAMLELVDEAYVVDNALSMAGPSGEITYCAGQLECFVDTTDTYSAYIQVGPPGAPDGVVSWVGPVTH